MDKKINDMNLNDYIDKIQTEYTTMLANGRTMQEAFTIIQLACQCYSADHMNQNIIGDITVKEN